MGPAGDPAAVVDQRLAVHGAENLWVADASVMVNVPTGLTNLTSYMIGERLADWLIAAESPHSAVGGDKTAV
jgi:choline dehydrogenase